MRLSCRVRWSLPHCPLQIEMPLQLSLSFTNGTSGFSELLPGLLFPQVNQRKIISIPKGYILGLQTLLSFNTVEIQCRKCSVWESLK